MSLVLEWLPQLPKATAYGLGQMMLVVVAATGLVMMAMAPVSARICCPVCIISTGSRKNVQRLLCGIG